MWDQRTRGLHLMGEHLQRTTLLNHVYCVFATMRPQHNLIDSDFSGNIASVDTIYKQNSGQAPKFRRANIAQVCPKGWEAGRGARTCLPWRHLKLSQYLISQALTYGNHTLVKPAVDLALFWELTKYIFLLNTSLSIRYRLLKFIKITRQIHGLLSHGEFFIPSVKLYRKHLTLYIERKSKKMFTFTLNHSYAIPLYKVNCLAILVSHVEINRELPDKRVPTLPQQTQVWSSRIRAKAKKWGRKRNAWFYGLGPETGPEASMMFHHTQHTLIHRCGPSLIRQPRLYAGHG